MCGDNCCQSASGRCWGKIVLWAWAVVATLFIGWQYLQSGAYSLGFGNGRLGAFNELASAALNQENCKSGFPVTLGEKQVTLVNVACLQAAADASKQPAAQPKK